MDTPVSAEVVAFVRIKEGLCKLECMESCVPPGGSRNVYVMRRARTSAEIQERRWKRRTMNYHNTAVAQLLLLDCLCFHKILIVERTKRRCLVETNNAVVCLDLLERPQHRGLVTSWLTR